MSTAEDEEHTQAVDVKPVTLKVYFYLEKLPNRPDTYIKDEFKGLILDNHEQPVPCSVLAELDPHPIVVVMAAHPDHAEMDMMGATEPADNASTLDFYTSSLNTSVPTLSINADTSARQVLLEKNAHPSWLLRNAAFFTPIELTYYQPEDDMAFSDEVIDAIAAMNVAELRVYHFAHSGSEDDEVSLEDDAIVATARLDLGAALAQMSASSGSKYVSIPLVYVHTDEGAGATGKHGRVFDEFGRPSSINVRLVSEEEEQMALAQEAEEGVGVAAGEGVGLLDAGAVEDQAHQLHHTHTEPATVSAPAVEAMGEAVGEGKGENATETGVTRVDESDGDGVFNEVSATVITEDARITSDAPAQQSEHPDDPTQQQPPQQTQEASQQQQHETPHEEQQDNHHENMTNHVSEDHQEARHGEPEDKQGGDQSGNEHESGHTAGTAHTETHAGVPDTEATSAEAISTVASDAAVAAHISTSTTAANADAANNDGSGKDGSAGGDTIIAVQNSEGANGAETEVKAEAETVLEAVVIDGDAVSARGALDGDSPSAAGAIGAMTAPATIAAEGSEAGDDAKVGEAVQNTVSAPTAEAGEAVESAESTTATDLTAINADTSDPASAVANMEVIDTAGPADFGPDAQAKTDVDATVSAEHVDLAEMPIAVEAAKAAEAADVGESAATTTPTSPVATAPAAPGVVESTSDRADEDADAQNDTPINTNISTADAASTTTDTVNIIGTTATITTMNTVEAAEAAVGADMSVNAADGAPEVASGANGTQDVDAGASGVAGVIAEAHISAPVDDTAHAIVTNDVGEAANTDAVIAEQVDEVEAAAQGKEVELAEVMEGDASTAMEETAVEALQEDKKTNDVDTGAGVDVVDEDTPTVALVATTATTGAATGAAVDAADEIKEQKPVMARRNSSNMGSMADVKQMTEATVVGVKTPIAGSGVVAAAVAAAEIRAEGVLATTNTSDEGEGVEAEGEESLVGDDASMFFTDADAVDAAQYGDTMVGDEGMTYGDNGDDHDDNIDNDAFSNRNNGGSNEKRKSVSFSGDPAGNRDNHHDDNRDNVEVEDNYTAYSGRHPNTALASQKHTSAPNATPTASASTATHTRTQSNVAPHSSGAAATHTSPNTSVHSSTATSAPSRSLAATPPAYASGSGNVSAHSTPSRMLSPRPPATAGSANATGTSNSSGTGTGVGSPALSRAVTPRRPLMPPPALTRPLTRPLARATVPMDGSATGTGGVRGDVSALDGSNARTVSGGGSGGVATASRPHTPTKRALAQTHSAGSDTNTTTATAAASGAGVVSRSRPPSVGTHSHHSTPGTHGDRDAHSTITCDNTVTNTSTSIGVAAGAGAGPTRVVASTHHYPSPARRASVAFLMDISHTHGHSSTHTSTDGTSGDESTPVSSTSATAEVDTSSLSQAGPVWQHRMKQLLQNNISLQQQLADSHAHAQQLQQQLQALRRVCDEKEESIRMSEERVNLLQRAVSELRRDVEEGRDKCVRAGEREGEMRGRMVRAEGEYVRMRTWALTYLRRAKAWRRVCIWVTCKMLVKVRKMKRMMASATEEVYTGMRELAESVADDDWMSRNDVDVDACVGTGGEKGLRDMIVAECRNKADGYGWEWEWEGEGSHTRKHGNHGARSDLRGGNKGGYRASNGPASLATLAAAPLSLVTAPSRGIAAALVSVSECATERVRVLTRQKQFWKETASSYQGYAIANAADGANRATHSLTARGSSGGNSSIGRGRSGGISVVVDEEEDVHESRPSTAVKLEDSVAENGTDGSGRVYTHAEVMHLRTRHLQQQHQHARREQQLSSQVLALQRQLRAAADAHAYRDKRARELQQHCAQLQKRYVTVVGAVGGAVALQQYPLPAPPVTTVAGCTGGVGVDTSTSSVAGEMERALVLPSVAGSGGGADGSADSVRIRVGDNRAALGVSGRGPPASTNANVSASQRGVRYMGDRERTLARERARDRQGTAAGYLGVKEGWGSGEVAGVGTGTSMGTGVRHNNHGTTYTNGNPHASSTSPHVHTARSAGMTATSNGATTVREKPTGPLLRLGNFIANQELQLFRGKNH